MLHSFEQKPPFDEATLKAIVQLKRVYGLELSKNRVLNNDLDGILALRAWRNVPRLLRTRCAPHNKRSTGSRRHGRVEAAALRHCGAQISESLSQGPLVSRSLASRHTAPRQAILTGSAPGR